MTCDERISLARAMIAGCLHADDHLAPGHWTPFVDSTVVVFTVACPDWERGAKLAHTSHRAFADIGMTAYARRILERGETRVEIRVVVGEVERAPSEAESCPYGNMPREAGAGHWRDWHRGHGCHLDPDRAQAGAP